jgi:glycine hydroxymethyltransferase
MTGDNAPHAGYFTDRLEAIDPEVADALKGELRRQQDGIELIASENIVSMATLDALASPIVNKTVEGYPGRRYYGGAEFADRVESLAIERATRLFGCGYANVQPHSGSQANLAVFLAAVKPGDTVLSMDLAAGGHLSHGAKANLTGKWFNIVHYGVRDDDGFLDYDAMAGLAREHRPRLIIAGGGSSSLPAFAPLPTKSARCSWPTWPTSPASSPVAPTRRRSPMPMWRRRRRTRTCAGSGAASC